MIVNNKEITFNNLVEYRKVKRELLKGNIVEVFQLDSTLLNSIITFNLEIVIEEVLRAKVKYINLYPLVLEAKKDLFNLDIENLVDFILENINSIVDYRVDMDLEEFLRVSIDLYFKNLVGGVELIRLKNYINNLEERIYYLEKSEKKLLNSFKEVDFNNPDTKKDYFYKLGRLSYRKSKLEVRRENLIKELKTLESLR